MYVYLCTLGSSLPRPVVVQDYVSTATSVSITFMVPLVVYTQEHYQVLYEGFEYQTHTSFSNEVIGNTDITALNENYTIEITGLEENHSYNFSVISYNCVGNTSSLTSTFTTKESSMSHYINYACTLAYANVLIINT